MTLESKARLDATDWTILEHLQSAGRMRFAELGRRMSLSPPAVAERVRRLEESGVITGYTATVDPSAVGLGIKAFIRVVTTPKTFPKMEALSAELPEIVDCHRTTGNGCFILKVRVRDLGHLERLLDRVMPVGEPEASVVLSTAIEARSVARPEAWSI